MKTATKISFTLSSQTLKQITKIAKVKGWTLSELCREALRQYIVQNEFKRTSLKAQKQLKTSSFKLSDINRIIKEYRQEKARK